MINYLTRKEKRQRLSGKKCQELMEDLEIMVGHGEEVRAITQNMKAILVRIMENLKKIIKMGIANLVIMENIPTQVQHYQNIKNKEKNKTKNHQVPIMAKCGM